MQRNLKALKTAPHPCAYLEAQEASTLFISDEEIIDNATFSELNRQGFRRSSNHVYRPACANCQACQSYRVLLNDFKPNKSQKRNLKAHQALTIRIEEARFSETDYQLYERYINQRHSDGDMYPPSEQQYRDFLFSDWCQSIQLKVFDNEKLIGVMFLDLLDDGLSAVYSFFDTSSAYNGLGIFMILQTIELCKNRGYPYCYLGYYIEESPKMHYKTAFKPAQIFKNHHWELLEDSCLRGNDEYARNDK